MNKDLFIFIANSRLMFRKYFQASGYGETAAADHMFDCVWHAYLDLQGIGHVSQYDLIRKKTDGIVDVMDTICRLAAMTFGGQACDYWSFEYTALRNELT